MKTKVYTIIVLVLIVSIWFMWFYDGYYPGMKIHSMEELPPVREEAGWGIRDFEKGVLLEGPKGDGWLRVYYLSPTSLGGVSLVRIRNDHRGATVEASCTFADKICTNFTMLRYRPGMSYEEMIASFGAPDSVQTTNSTKIIYRTVSGIAYVLNVRNGVCTDMNLDVGLNNMPLVLFQGVVRMIGYLLVAMVTTFFVRLLKKIEKRKADRLTDLQGGVPL